MFTIVAIFCIRNISDKAKSGINLVLFSPRFYFKIQHTLANKKESVLYCLH